jgi:hypothetical protein
VPYDREVIDIVAQIAEIVFTALGARFGETLVGA